MSEQFDNPSTSSKIRSIGQIFRITGWISFVLQLVLGVVSSLLLLVFSIRPPGSPSSSAETGFGVFLAVCGIVALGISIYLAFRCKNIGRQLQSTNPSNRPRKVETVKTLQLALTVNLVGMLLTLLGAQAIVGSLVFKAARQVGVVSFSSANTFITAQDMFVVQANANTITAHFVGLAASIWLLNRITK
ncbi:DUF3611 family protein [Rivularia sp. PCC 7116]|uniref:DUF3611 family protein n=1 Tax=Rivularia sp. PCC 7116 TaxID=373994 RepID=UPI0005C7CE84|nr:DUF3611 family protein [Rivularia sp. PCC 7116]